MRRAAIFLCLTFTAFAFSDSGTHSVVNSSTIKNSRQFERSSKIPLTLVGVYVNSDCTPLGKQKSSAMMTRITHSKITMETLVYPEPKCQGKPRIANVHTISQFAKAIDDSVMTHQLENHVIRYGEHTLFDWQELLLADKQFLADRHGKYYNKGSIKKLTKAEITDGYRISKDSFAKALIKATYPKLVFKMMKDRGFRLSDGEFLKMWLEREKKAMNSNFGVLGEMWDDTLADDTLVNEIRERRFEGEKPKGFIVRSLRNQFKKMDADAFVKRLDASKSFRTLLNSLTLPEKFYVLNHIYNIPSGKFSAQQYRDISKIPQLIDGVPKRHEFWDVLKGNDSKAKTSNIFD